MGRLAVICALLKHTTPIVIYADDVSRFRLLLKCVAFKCRANAFPGATFESSQLSLNGRAVVVPSSLDFGDLTSAAKRCQEPQGKIKSSDLGGEEKTDNTKLVKT